jgi:hypothetical protein
MASSATAVGRAVSVGVVGRGLFVDVAAGVASDVGESCWVGEACLTAVPAAAQRLHTKVGVGPAQAAAGPRRASFKSMMVSFRLNPPPRQ